MSICLGNYSFSGPVESIDKIKNLPGIYAIVCIVEGEYFLIDVGESSKLRTKIENHCKTECWTKNCKGQLAIFIHYTVLLKQRERIFIEQELRELFHPDCKAEKKIWFPKVLP
jgi:hypothetical protein